MRANINFIREKFLEFNNLYFGGKLPDLHIQINSSKRTLGQFITLSNYPEALPRGTGECCIRISSRFDLSQNDIEDTLIHEMIHYLIWVERLEDSAPHGPIFRSIMNDINRRYGRNLSVRKSLSEDEISSDKKCRSNYIMVIEWDTSELSMSVCAKTRIFEFYRYFSNHTRVKELKWFWSASPWFNSFPVCRTLKTYKLTRQDFEEQFRTATKCECDGKYFRPIKSK